MTSDRHLALMALMRDIEEPAKAYQRSIRLAASTETDSPLNLQAIERGKAALDLIELAVRSWTDQHRPEAVPGLCNVPSPDGRFMCRLEPHGVEEMHSDRPEAAIRPNGRRTVWETPAELPSGFERKTCVTVACAACGYPYDEAEFTMHFPSAPEASNHVVSDGWDELKDGRLLCMRGDDKHEELRRTVGVIDPDDDTEQTEGQR